MSKLLEVTNNQTDTPIDANITMPHSRVVVRTQWI